MKFVYENSEDQEKHWDDCQKNKAPYIVISNVDMVYKQIFYDITNYKLDLDEVSSSVEEIYRSYVEFFLIPYSDINSLFNQYYFFNIIVLQEHAEFIADKLFDYLRSKLQQI
jgi:hypothetical protein